MSSGSLVNLAGGAEHRRIANYGGQRPSHIASGINALGCLSSSVIAGRRLARKDGLPCCRIPDGGSVGCLQQRIRDNLGNVVDG
jgi:hypothetical protein